MRAQEGPHAVVGGLHHRYARFLVSARTVTARVMPEAPSPSSPRGRLREPRHRLLADRPIDQRGEYAEADRDPPDQVIVALDVVEPPGAPAAEEAAELMTEEHDAPEHRHVGGTEHVADEPAGEWDGTEPQEAERRREQQHRDP